MFRPAKCIRASNRATGRWGITWFRTAPPNRIACTCAIRDLHSLQALETMCKGRMLADVVAVIGSIDIVLGEIDR